MIAELLGHAFRRWKPILGWPAFVLLVLTTWLAALGIMQAEWVENDSLLLLLTQASLFLSAALAHTRLSGRWGALIVAVAGVLLTGQALGRILPPPLGGLIQLWEGLGYLLVRPWDPDILPPDMALWRESWTRLVAFAEHLAAWGAGLFGAQGEENPIAFLFVSGLILWACAAWAAWATIRKARPLPALLPLGTVLSMSTFLSSGPLGYLIGFLACLTLLIPITHLRQQERRWDREGTDYSPEIRLDVWQVAIVVMIAVVVLSAVTPSFSVPRIVNSAWKLISRPQETVEDLLTRFFGGVEPENPPDRPVETAGGGGAGPVEAALPRAHLLGGNPGLSRRLVMYVCTDDPPPMPEDLFPEEIVFGPKHYWRGITYDTFSGRMWSNGPSSSNRIPPHQPVYSSTVTPTVLLQQRYLIQVPHGVTIYAAGEPHTVDQEVTSKLRAVDDLVGLESAISGYIVHSRVSQATASQLMASQHTYTDHIVHRYLSVHESLPERVRSLAAEISANAHTAYDKAVAIEAYLRQFPYDLNVASPPPGRDVVDYFLFDAQRGYCDYFASSFVVLARLAGVPARLAVGYAMGGYNPDRDCYEVTERDAHSWPEVYFSGHGWIPFEPTGSLRQFERPAEPVSYPLHTPSAPSIPKRPWDVAVGAWWRRVSGNWTTYVAIACGTIATAVLVAWQILRWRRSQLSPVEAIAAYYERMRRHGGKLGAPLLQHLTPSEYEALLAAVIRARTARWPWSGDTLAATVERTDRGLAAIRRAYERASYDLRAPDRGYQQWVERRWQELHRLLWRLRLASRAGPSKPQ